MQCGRPGQMTKPKNIPPLTDKELEKLSPEELRAELRYLRAENAYLKKLKALVQSEKKWQKALIISELRHEHALRDLLRAAGMSRSTWYYNMNALKQGDRYAGLKENIRKIYHYHKGRYGYRRITLALRKQGLRINHKTVQRLMAELSLRSVIRAKKISCLERENGRGRAQYPEPELRCVKSQRKMGNRCDRVPGTGKKALPVVSSRSV